MGLLNYTTAKINELLAKVAALPAKVMDGDTKIPARTSDLENDSKFVKETGLKTINGQSIVGSGNIFIQSGSGEGGAGNVNVSNAAELVGGGQYVFIPSANGVSEGSFKKLNVADDINSGLMSANDHRKLKN